MSPLPLAKCLLGTLVSTLALQVTANPIVNPRNQHIENALRRRAAMNVVQTTSTDASTIDWVPIDSQGEIASPPPARNVSYTGSKPVAELQQPGAKLGPSGTVPIPQVNLTYMASTASKSLPEMRAAGSKAKRDDYAGNHWYVSANQAVDNLGGSAIYSLFKPFVNNDADFSLLQTALVKSSTNGDQTLEAGWINYPKQVSKPHLFTYFTTDGYASNADNKGGWNQDVAGWVQYDSEIFPGTVFSPTSVNGGAQYDMEIMYYLYGGNWWLWVLDRWIGYYPASLYSNGISGSSLADGSENIFYYGEIYQSEAALTTTDMGSGEFASAGAGYAAYLKNMHYIDTNTYLQDFDAGFWDSDSSRYSHEDHLLSGTDDESYVYLGGPGEGGDVGA